jgi:hypothetical protein
LRMGSESAEMKGETMYTKGPWIYDNMQDNYYGNVIRINGTVICRMINQGTMSVMEHNANAHLISACPDLLEACRALLEKFNSRTALIETCDMTDGELKAVKKTEQAISKATGENA